MADRLTEAQRDGLTLLASKPEGRAWVQDYRLWSALQELIFTDMIDTFYAMPLGGYMISIGPAGRSALAQFPHEETP